ncbi:MAG: glycosyl transferase [Roseateles depolymerans]|uniref:Glycosyl transferase n=1 Tax=Roseateles depolymerans TaxID=76731 RepID=A0A2W5DU25_9BURK|nr:MAG: glycosyl transferase [Roseateles depolymerans]PZR24157.1 MAG: glycosyl transferase [Azospira oryzae]
MKILHLSSVYAPQRIGGAEKVVEMLAEHSAALGHEVAVAHIAPEPAPPHQRHGVAVHPLRHRNPLWIGDSGRHPLLRQANKVATLFNVFTTADFARLLRELRPDVVHSHSMVELPPWVWQVAASQGCAVVHTLHDYDLLCIRSSLFKDGAHCVPRHTACRMFSRVKLTQHGHIHQVVGVSQAILDRHLQDGCFAQLPEASRHVIWNPVMPAPARPRAGDSGPRRFGFIGRLVPEKGLATLIEACRQLPAEGWQLRIAGRLGEQEAELRRLVEGLPVELVGYVDPAEFLATLDTLVVPSVWLEPFGLTTVEAYAAGVPVIGADTAGVAEIVGAVDPGALVPPGDAAALAALMQAVLRDGPRPLPAAARAAVLERTRPGPVAQAYDAVYRRALAQLRRAPQELARPA